MSLPVDRAEQRAVGVESAAAAGIDRLVYSNQIPQIRGGVIASARNETRLEKLVSGLKRKI